MKIKETAQSWTRMRELERFGVGSFSEEEVADKTAYVNRIMKARSVPEHPFLSVVIPAHCEEKYILATLRSLAEQKYQNCEFIIVSNGERDGNSTQRIAEACGFRVIHDSIGGISRARQTGLEAAKGEIVVTTDADTVHHSGWLERISEIMSDPNIPCGAGLWRSNSPYFSVRLVFAWIAFTHRIKNAIHPKLVTGVSEAASFYRRELALSAGGYDPTVMLSEGLMMFRKLRKPGVPIIFTDEELVVTTSGRRQERQGAIHWFLLGFWNATLQLLGKKGVGQESYPHHIR